MLQALSRMFKKQPEVCLLAPYQQEMNEKFAFTPDMLKLEEYFFQLVFICNEHMTGCIKHKDFIEGQAVKLAAAFTAQDNYVLWLKNLGDHSQVFPLEMTADQQLGNTTLFGPTAKILGQLYATRAPVINSLDTALMNGVQYTRKRIKVEVPYSYVSLPTDRKEGNLPRVRGATAHERRTATLTAWAYIGRTDYWAEQINPTSNLFKPVKTYSSAKDDPYYFYAQSVEQKRGK